MADRNASGELLTTPQRYSFSQLLRLLSHSREKRDIKIRSLLYGRWSENEIASVEASETEIKVTANLTCLTGPKGIMPHYFQDALHQSAIELQEGGLFAFIDIFNSILLHKQFQADVYTSLPMSFEAVAFTRGRPVQGLLDLSGLPHWHDESFRPLWRYHSRLKTGFCHLSGYDRILSSYFNMTITVRRESFSRKTLDDDCLWFLGKRCQGNEGLGAGLLLGQSVLLKGGRLIVHLNIDCQEQWQKVQTDQHFIDELYRFSEFILHDDAVVCLADLDGALLNSPVLGGAFQLGQYQLLRPESLFNERVSVLLKRYK